MCRYHGFLVLGCEEFDYWAEKEFRCRKWVGFESCEYSHDHDVTILKVTMKDGENLLSTRPEQIEMLRRAQCALEENPRWWMV